MSIKTWKKEFYPVAASSKKAQKDPIAHSLLKWTGLLKKNLKKHGVEHYARWIDDDLYDELEISDESCALCQMFYYSPEDMLLECSTCPIVLATGKRCDGYYNAPYGAWVDTGNAMPMIRTLKKAQKLWKGWSK